MNKYTKLTSTERDQLTIWKAAGLSNRECARRLGRDPSTIGRELKRNDWRCNGEHYYVAIHAQAQADKREVKAAHSKHPLKNADVFAYVTDHLRGGWSPDQIAGRLKLEHPDDPYWSICAETIYQWIYQKDQRANHWWEYLRRKQQKRRKQKGRKVHRSHIPDRVSIRLRPETVNKREEFGHWEGDTVVSLGRRDGIHTEVERISKRILASHVSSLQSEETAKVQGQLFGKLPKGARRSTTLDNGKENHSHFRLHNLGMNTYFADPYSAWQRGTNENGNWHLRYYFPKGTDFKTVLNDELQDVVEEINNRPRKILNYRTAQEVYLELQARGCSSN